MNWIKAKDEKPDLYKICEVQFKPTEEGVYKSTPLGYPWLAVNDEGKNIWTLWGTNLIIEVLEWRYWDSNSVELKPC